jgi:hypothetical protein
MAAVAELEAGMISARRLLEAASPFDGEELSAA